MLSLLSKQCIHVVACMLMCMVWCICRGKFDCAFFSDTLQVANKQTSAQIPYGSIQHVLVSCCRAAFTRLQADSAVSNASV